MSAVGTPETLPQQPPLSRRKEKKAVKMAAKLKLAGSVDVRVQHTNDDSVVSKRSAVKLKYLTDDILPYFVTKPARRSPLINRGYYLRMKVMYELIDICCTHLRQECGSECPVQVISLGAGYDTTAVRFITQQGKDGSSTLQEPICFYDVDFPAVMQAKAALLEGMAEKLPDVVLNPKDAICPLRSPIYTALGVDLREASTVLVPQLQAFSDSFSVDYPTIIYAECVTQYMPSEETAALVGFLARTFPKAMFMAYDQLQPADSFGKLMCHSLRQKNSPLMGIEACPSGESMIQRALSQGMKDAAFTNFYDLSRHVLQGDERARVDALEPFDEIEEWSEMCEHYGITVATTLANLDGMLRANPFLKRKEDPPQLHDVENLPLVAQSWPTGRFGFEGWGHGAVQSETLSNGDVLLISFGGFQAKGGGHQRVNQVFVHSFFEGELHVAQSEADMVPNLIFHSVSRIAPFQYVVFGGRTNPSNASNTAYLLTVVVPRSISSTSSIVAMWKELRVDVGCVAPSPRFRHVAVATSPSELLVIGGKSPSGSLLNDVWRGTLSTSTGTVTWKEESLRGVDAPIPPMCSAAAVLSPAGDAVIISGGLLANDHCSKAMYRLQLSSMELVRYDLMLDGRCSHTMTPCVIDGSSFLLILGGSGDAPKSTTHIEEVAVLVDFPTLREAKLVALPPDAPTWSRHSCVALGPQGVLAVIGGGFTCFSFGTFSAKPHILRIGHNPGPLPHVQKKQLSSSLTQPSGSLAALLPIPRESVVEQEYTNARVLEAIHNGSQPVVFRHTPFGACVEKWKDPAYLEEAERGTMVSVHVAQGNPHLDFVRKNFAFRHVPFEELVGHVVKSQAHFKQHQTVPEEVMYYRSIAGHMMSERANFWKDFRTLQADFSLPGEAGDFIQARVHQSCLRINAAPLQLWTHYDTCDNVLCQIVGRKRVVLFPPSAYNDLYIKGSSSAVINIDDPDLLQYPRFVEAHKSAVEVVLEPGDMLFFPSMWFHHCTTLDDDYSVSVNVFFRRFGEEDYDKKDLYGNKDIPACTSMREAIVADVKNRVARLRLDGSGNEVPPEYTEFALREAIQDLEEYVESMAAARRVQRLQHTASSLASQTTK